jgi:hypothetical protein
MEFRLISCSLRTEQASVVPEGERGESRSTSIVGAKRSGRFNPDHRSGVVSLRTPLHTRAER